MTQMDCDGFRAKLHPLLDGELSADDEAGMHEHMASCADCREEYEQLSAVRDMLSHMDDDLEPPIEFEQGWRKAVRAERRLGRTRRWTRALSCVAAGFVLLAGATALNRFASAPEAPLAADAAIESPAPADVSAEHGLLPDFDTAAAKATDDGAMAVRSAMLPGDSAGDESADIPAQYSYSKDDNLGATTSGGLLDVGDDSAVSGSSMKVLRSAALTIETSSFDDDMAQIKTVVAKFGGLFERNAITGENGSRTAELTLRVPAGFLETFVEQLRAIGCVTSSEVSAQDITSQYTDTALLLDSYRTQLTRVKELTAEAADLSEVLALEAEASRLQYEIDKLSGALRGWDSQAELSTVTIVLSEYDQVQAAFSSGFTGELGERFSASMHEVGSFFGDMMLTAMSFLPPLVWIAPLGALAILGAKLFGRGRRRHAD